MNNTAFKITVTINSIHSKKKRERLENWNLFSFHLPLTIWTCTLLEWVLLGEHVYRPASLSIAFWISKRLEVTGPFSVTKLIPPLGESKLIACERRKEDRQSAPSITSWLQPNRATPDEGDDKCLLRVARSIPTEQMPLKHVPVLKILPLLFPFRVFK